MDLPSLIKDDLADVLPDLMTAGLVLTSCQFSPEAFGNFLVSFTGGKSGLDITRDRGEYFLGGNRQLLQQIGYWRALNKQELADGVRSFLAAAA
jgi:hypothetical protein